MVFHSLRQCNLYVETGHAVVRQVGLHCLVKYDPSKIVRDQFIIGTIAKLLKQRGREDHTFTAYSSFHAHDLSSIICLCLLKLGH